MSAQNQWQPGRALWFAQANPLLDRPALWDEMAPEDKADYARQEHMVLRAFYAKVYQMVKQDCPQTGMSHQTAMRKILEKY
jgi:hypothetical protein